MERLLTVNDIMERYGKSRQTAIRYIKQMEHQEKPYAVTEAAVRRWDASRTVNPPALIRAEMRRQRALKRMRGGQTA